MFKSLQQFKKKSGNILKAPRNSRTDVVRMLAERYETKSNVKLDGFRSQLQESYVFNPTEVL